MNNTLKNIVTISFLIGFGKVSFSQTTNTKHIIEIQKMKFVPAELHVKKGDTVVWINKDFLPHNIADIDNKSWKSNILKKDKSWLKVITENEDYYCTLHVVMKGKIKIK